jgi:tRNA threonylcarbamoyladenosine biosynthesis protein TsaB
VILGFDTATPATAAALWAPGGPAVERRDDPEPGARPGHAGRLLVLIEEVLAAAGASWANVERLAVGVGPGGFTGLRLGVATARALAQARDLPLVAVSSLEALAAGANTSFDRHRGSDPIAHPQRQLGSDPPVVAMIDARRGEVFAAAWAGRVRVLDPVAIAPADLAARIGEPPLAAPLAVGDGAVRFREQLVRAGAVVPEDGAPVHRVSALQVCRLGAEGQPVDRDALLPDYRREPDAKPPKTP